MKCTGYLNINSRGTARFTKSRIGLDWDEIAIKVTIDIPNEMFARPILEASIEVGKEIIPKPQPFDLILKTKDLIEESTGVKINFSVVPYDDEEAT